MLSTTSINFLLKSHALISAYFLILSYIYIILYNTKNPRKFLNSIYRLIFSISVTITGCDQLTIFSLSTFVLFRNSGNLYFLLSSSQFLTNNTDNFSHFPNQPVQFPRTPIHNNTVIRNIPLYCSKFPYKFRLCGPDFREVSESCYYW